MRLFPNLSEAFSAASGSSNPSWVAAIQGFIRSPLLARDFNPARSGAM
jgi:hypothetical protein